MQLADVESTVSVPLHPLATQVLGNRYELIGVAGSGGAASVFRAHDRILGRTVAVKVLEPKFAEDREYVARFQREAEFAANLSGHPNVVSVFDVGQEGRLRYIIMEAVDGRDLKSVIEQEAPLPVGRALTIAQQVASALAFAHAHGLVHRDVKPQNILLLAGDHVKVTDFGIARNVGATPVTDGQPIMGTSHYLSPEQVLGKRADARSDIYALGVVLYEILTGAVPFDGDDEFAVGMRHVTEAPRPPERLNPAVPPAVSAAVLRALSKQPADRYPDVEAFAAALQRAAPDSSPSSPHPGSIWQRVPDEHTVLNPTRRLPVEQERPRTWSRYAMPAVMATLGLLFLLGVAGLALSSWLAHHSVAAHHRNQKHSVAAGSPSPPTVVRRHAAAPCSSQATSGIDLLGVSFAPPQVAAGGTSTLTYQIANSGPCRKIYLGATVSSQISRAYPSFSDPQHARVVTVRPGVHVYSRPFVLPAGAAGQTLAVTGTLSISGGPRIKAFGPYYNAVTVMP